MLHQSEKEKMRIDDLPFEIWYRIVLCWINSFYPWTKLYPIQSTIDYDTKKNHALFATFRLRHVCRLFKNVADFIIEKKFKVKIPSNWVKIDFFINYYLKNMKLFFLNRRVICDGELSLGKLEKFVQFLLNDNSDRCWCFHKSEVNSAFSKDLTLFQVKKEMYNEHLYCSVFRSDNKESWYFSDPRFTDPFLSLINDDEENNFLSHFRETYLKYRKFQSDDDKYCLIFEKNDESDLLCFGFFVHLNR